MNQFVSLSQQPHVTFSLTLILGAVLIALMGCLAACFIMARKTKTIANHQRKELQTMSSLCKHLIGLEHKISTLAPAQAPVSEPDATEHTAKALSYARTLVTSGSSLDEVVATSGLSYSEAEILECLHADA